MALARLEVTAVRNLRRVSAQGAAFTYNTTAANATMAAGAVTNSNTGSGQSVNNMQPYLVINFSIALEGIFPSRN